MSTRLHAVAEALTRRSILVVPAEYSEERAEEVCQQLEQCSGVLVWVNPIADGRDRTLLDGLLRELSTQGAWVSAYPDIILKMGVKEVLYRTRGLGWVLTFMCIAPPKTLLAHFQRAWFRTAPV
jgi:hypothetical protein